MLVNESIRPMIERFVKVAGITDSKQQIAVFLSEVKEYDDVVAVANKAAAKQKKSVRPRKVLLLDALADMLFVLVVLDILGDERYREYDEYHRMYHQRLTDRTSHEYDVTQVERYLAGVCESNLSKFDATENEARMSVARYLSQGIDADYIEREGVFVIVAEGEQHHEELGHIPDGKILKGCNYQPPVSLNKTR